MKEPLNRNQAIKLICLQGTVVVSRHAETELAKDDLTTVDARNVLRGGRILEAPELVNGSWRYRIHT